MNAFTEEEHEHHAGLCLRLAHQWWKENGVDMAIKRTEEALRSLKALQEMQEIKKAN